MSYILEALRKSQQEREMTQAPAAMLDTLSGAAEAGGSNRWAIATTLMAVVAVAISLYAVLGSRLNSTSQTEDLSSRPAVATSQRTAGDQPDPASDQDPRPVSTLASAAPDSTPALARLDVSGGVSPDRSELTSPAGSAEVEQPRPMTAPPADATARVPPTPPRGIVIPDANTAGMTDLAAEETPVEAIETGVQQGQAPGVGVLPIEQAQQQDPSDPLPTGHTRVDSSEDSPRGFRREAELLRDRLLDLGRALEEEQQLPGVTPERAEVREAPSLPSRPIVAKAQPQTGGGVSTDRIAAVGELPAHVFQKLPPRNILVHVYNENPEKRFIILNSQRQRQGDTTKDGFVIEEIKPDGVVLRFQGERFFNPR